MGWERRGRSIYYYRKRRVEGRVVSEYAGTSFFAGMGASAVAEAKRNRKSERAVLDEARADDRRVDEVLMEFGTLARAITRGYLIVLGFHRHKGEWRHRREKTK